MMSAENTTEASNFSETVVVNELDQIISRIMKDRAGINEALANEKAESIELKRRIGKLTAENLRVKERERRCVNRVEQLTKAGYELERHYETMMADRNHEIDRLRQDQEQLGREWSVRFRRLAESHDREVMALGRELTVARREIDTLRSELSMTRTRPSGRPSTPGPGGDDSSSENLFILDGDALAGLIWPDLDLDEARLHLAEAVEDHGRRIGVMAELVFQSAGGLERLPSGCHYIRVRVPKREVPLETVIRQLDDANGERYDIHVVTDRSGFVNSVPLDHYADWLGVLPTGLGPFPTLGT